MKVEEKLSVSSTIEIRPVSFSNRQDKMTFIKVPWQVYRQGENFDPHWVPPLIIDEKKTFNLQKNPLYKHVKIQAFVAYQSGRVVGRIAAMRDENFIEVKKKQLGFFGFFELLDNKEVACALLKAAESWCIQQGCSAVMGPVELNPNIKLGLLIENFSCPPVLYTPYNRPYYQKFIENYGFEKSFDFFAYYYDREQLELPKKIDRIVELVHKRSNVEIRPMSKKTWRKDAEHVLKIWNETWFHHPEFVPWVNEDFFYMAKDMKPIVNEDFVQLAFVNGEPAAFSFPFPDLNEAFIHGNGQLTPALIFRLLRSLKKGRILRIAVMGVREKFQKNGIEAIFLSHIYHTAMKKGYTFGDMSLIVDSNTKLLRLLDNLGMKAYRRYRVFEKRVENE